MITVGYSTRKINHKFVEYIKSTIGPKNVEVIAIENEGKYSLTQAYNMILDQAQNDIVILMHDDIYFDNKSWGSNVLYHFQKNPEYGILGVAGTTHMPKSGQWWEDRSKMHGIVNHEHQGKKWESKYSNSLGKKIQDVVVVDGLFMCVNKNNITKNFNEEVKGFHMYDIDFCFRNFLDEVKVGVIYDVRVTHKSIGMTNQEWEKNKNQFAETYKDNLPAKILKDENSVLKILLLCDKLNSDTLSSLKKHNLTIVSEIKSGKKNVFNLDSIPGTILGDGKLQLNVGTNTIPTVKGRLYKNKNIEYDLIISNSKLLSDKIKIAYPNTNHLFIGNNIVNHSSIITQNTIPKDLYRLSNIEINKPKVKILTGFSERGGSTFALSRICNYFNENGIDTVMYGPHDFHLGLCKSDIHSNFKIEDDDILITHFVSFEQRPNVKKVVLSCHEKNIFEISKLDRYWDEVVFLNKKQRDYHSGYNGEYSIIPNFSDYFEVVKSDESIGVAGIIGSIDYNKQTHISIERALSDGYKKVILFGGVTDVNYYESYVKPLIDGKTVIEYGFINDKSKMYSMIECVYQSSLSEVASLVKDECEMTGTKFNGNSNIDNDTKPLSNDEIFKNWKKILGL